MSAPRVTYRKLKFPSMDVFSTFYFLYGPSFNFPFHGRPVGDWQRLPIAAVSSRANSFVLYQQKSCVHSVPAHGRKTEVARPWRQAGRGRVQAVSRIWLRFWFRKHHPSTIIIALQLYGCRKGSRRGLTRIFSFISC